MKVLYVIHYPVFGGPHNEALRLARPLLERGWETIVLLPDEPGNAAERLATEGIEVVRGPLHRVRAGVDPRLHLRLALGLAPEVASIRRLLRERQIDLVLIGGLLNPHAGIAGVLEKVPVVWQVVDTRAPRLLRRAFMPLVSRLADAVMFNGRSLIRSHVPGGVLDIPYAVYPAPVDTSRFEGDDDARREVRESLGVPDQGSLIGTVANLNPQKGLEYFIRAAAIIHAAEPDTWFAVVGAYHETHQDYAHRLEAAARQSGIPRTQFIFTGDRDDAERFYAAMDVKLITSVRRSEGTTTTAAEAMACGVPVVATDVGAVSEVVDEGVTGFLVSPEDSSAIAERTLMLIRDPALRAEMGAAGRKRAVEHFDVNVCVERYVRTFSLARRRHRLRMRPVATPRELRA
jgi:glycosyltransferase involved in cell wall biosynthesis